MNDGDGDGDDGDDDDEPICITLARGSKIRQCLRAGALIVAPMDTDNLPAHLQAFRFVYCRAESDGPGAWQLVVRKVWRALLPGLGQLWYRFFHCWQRFPYRLLLLVAPSVSDATQAEIDSWPDPTGSAFSGCTAVRGGGSGGRAARRRHGTAVTASDGQCQCLRLVSQFLSCRPMI